ncbi:MAG: hypothetical protein ACXWJX_19140 [Limisphaerales bacterium]
MFYRASVQKANSYHSAVITHNVTVEVSVISNGDNALAVGNPTQKQVQFICGLAVVAAIFYSWLFTL